MKNKKVKIKNLTQIIFFIINIRSMGSIKFVKLSKINLKDNTDSN